MTIAQIKKWFEVSTPEPTEKNFTTQTGVHYEEVAEMTDEIVGLDETSERRVAELRAILHAFATDLKKGEIKIGVRNGKDLLDALCDQVVTAVGVAHMTNVDMTGGLQEVADSNDSKFVDGVAIRDENQKIIKGPDYFKADLAKFATDTRFLAPKAA